MLSASATGEFTIHTLRLVPGEDLKRQIASFAQTHGIPAAFVMSAVGSLSEVELRTAGTSFATRLVADLEIVGLGGTIAKGGAVHLHVVVADATGKTHGGHLVGGVVRTTAEIVLGAPAGLVFERAVDSATGYYELVPTATTAPLPLPT